MANMYEISTSMSTFPFVKFVKVKFKVVVVAVFFVVVVSAVRGYQMLVSVITYTY